jgi:hypothetical protein
MALKLKTRTKFPAVVSATSPIVITKNGVSYTFSFDASALNLGSIYASLANNLSDLSFKYTAKDNISIHGANIASAATVNLETATGDLVDVTGTVSITAITLNEGHERTVRFTGILTLTNGASLVLPGSANITTAAGDFAIFRGYAAGVVRCVSYAPATGKGVIGPALGDITGFGTGIATALAINTGSAGAPALVNGVLGTATATTLNKVTITAPASSATLTLIDGTVITGPAATGTLVTKTSTDILTNKTFDSAGTGNSLQVGSVALSKGQYPGETTTGSATAGNVGEYVETVVVTGSAVSVVTATGKTIMSISLTAGDWDVECNAVHNFNTTTSFTQLITSLSLTTNVVDSTPGRFQQDVRPANVPGLTSISQVVQRYRFSLSATTTIFLVAQDTFTVSTMAVYGLLRARRAR